MEFNEILKWYLIALLPVAFVAWYKNRSVLSWVLLSLVFSPLLMIIWLLFLNTVEVYTYEGEKNLSNDSYKIYLTKQYYIEKVETIGKYQCFGKIFESADDALKYAFNVDRGLPPETVIENSNLIPAVIKINEQKKEKNKSKKENRKLKSILIITTLVFFVCGFLYVKKDELIKYKLVENSPKVDISAKTSVEVINELYHLLECTNNCIDAKVVVFSNGKKIEYVDNEDDSLKKLLVNGKEYDNIPFEMGGFLSINSIYPNKNGDASIALLTWNYRGSCCPWTEYHIVYADANNLIPIKLDIFDFNLDTFDEISFNIIDGKISKINVLSTRKDEKISTPLVR